VVATAVSVGGVRVGDVRVGDERVTSAGVEALFDFRNFILSCVLSVFLFLCGVRCTVVCLSM
jgi:hypothetical protein